LAKSREDEIGQDLENTIKHIPEDPPLLYWSCTIAELERLLPKVVLPQGKARLPWDPVSFKGLIMSVIEELLLTLIDDRSGIVKAGRPWRRLSVNPRR